MQVCDRASPLSFGLSEAMRRARQILCGNSERPVERYLIPILTPLHASAQHLSDLPDDVFGGNPAGLDRGDH